VVLAGRSGDAGAVEQGWAGIWQWDGAALAA